VSEIIGVSGKEKEYKKKQGVLLVMSKTCHQFSVGSFLLLFIFVASITTTTIAGDVEYDLEKGGYNELKYSGNAYDLDVIDMYDAEEYKQDGSIFEYDGNEEDAEECNHGMGYKEKEEETEAEAEEQNGEKYHEQEEDDVEFNHVTYECDEDGECETIDTEEEEEDYANYNTEEEEHPKEEEDSKKSKRREALIVCGVDGTVYTLDVWTGSLRGLFTSGSPLVSSSSSSTSSDKETIVPGLDGHLYTLTSVGNTMDEEEVQIDVLPVSVMDVISSPVSTCTHLSSSSEEECGIVLGEKKTQIYAIDPYSGRVQWRQDPSGGGSFTKSQTSSKEKRSVLLQREDYVVRHVTAGGGDEVWNVTVGQFSALDFGTTSPATSAGGSSNSAGTGTSLASSSTRDKKKIAHPQMAAAKAASASLELPSLKLPIRSKKIVGLNNRGSSSGRAALPSGEEEDEEEEFELYEEEEEEDLFVLPSIAFGEDGTSIIAVDSNTGELLWKRRIESVVAAVYGVGRESGWAPLNVVDEPHHHLHHQNHPEHAHPKIDGPSYSSALTTWLEEEEHLDLDHNPSSSVKQGSSLATFLLPPYPDDLFSEEEEGFSSSSLAPYSFRDGAKQNLPGRNNFARLGRHSSTLFVASSSLLPHLKHSFLEKEEDETAALSVYDDAAHTGGHFFGKHHHQQQQQPYSNTESIKTEHGGLFLSWRVVSLLVTLLFACVGFARMAYIQQKRKWEEQNNSQQHTPLLVSTAPNSREGINANDLNQSTITALLPTHFSLGASNALANAGGGGDMDYDSAIANTPLHGRHRLNSLGHFNDLTQQQQLSQNDTNADQATALTTLTTVSSRTFKRSMSLPQVSTLDDGKQHQGIGLPLYDIQQQQQQHLSSELPTLAATTATVGTKSGGVQTQTDIKSEEAALQRINDGSEENTAAVVPPPPAATSPAAPDPQESAVGSLVDGMPLVKYSRYRSEFHEISALGKGGFGTVFKCSNALDGREYAVKKIWLTSHIDPNNGQAMNQNKIRRVLREVKILALLDHPNIVRYYTAWFELEEKGTSDKEDSGSDTFTSTMDKRLTLTRCFSSELLTVGGGSSGPTSRGGGTGTVSKNSSWQHSMSSRYKIGRRGNISKRKNTYLTGENSNGVGGCADINGSNPLCPNNFQSEQTIRWDEANIGLLAAGVNASSLNDEEDLGFNWERSSSGLSDAQLAASANRLSTINDKGEENWSVSEQSTSSNNGDSSSASTSGDDDDSSSSSSSNSSSDSSIDSDDDGAPNEKLNALSSSFEDQSKEKGDPPRHSNVTPISKSCHDEKASQKMTTSSSSPTDTKGNNLTKFHPANRQRYILYIQMQLCSHKTVGDFLSDLEARKGSSSDKTNWVDIPYALRLFSQIARGVKHVHQLGLIHRDLKPSNCFIDDGVVKIGDFGLSRESTTTGGLGEELGGEDELTGGQGRKGKDIENIEDRRESLGGGEDNTAGVGTRSYASPEQMNGSDYDASTDVYSLGVMLFELCYPMNTGMERHMVFSGIRKQIFPDQWYKTVAESFQSLHSLIMAMLSVLPSERPSAAKVANHIDTLLGEYTVLSLDRSHHQRKGSVLLRVEATESEGVLPRTIKLIKEASPDITIMQYGLRGQQSKAIMEFALSRPNVDDDDDDEDDNKEAGKKDSSSNQPDDTSTIEAPQVAKGCSIQRILTKLNESEEIIVVREVTEKHLVMGRGNGIKSI